MTRLNAPVLDADGFDVRVEARVLLRGLRIRVERGQRWALLGRNGAGKSTLLRAFAGLDGMAQGLRLNGDPLTQLGPRELARRRAYMHAQARDRFGLGVLHAVMLAQPEPDARAARAVLEECDCAALEGRSVLQISAGERQRVALAQVLAQGVDLLLLDEPASFQDPGHQGMVSRLLAARTGQAMVFAAHDVNWVAGLATHVLAFEPDGAYSAGPCESVLRAEVLARVYGCRWERVPRSAGGAVWMPS